MAKNAVYGIDYLKLSPSIEIGETSGTYPDFEKIASKFSVTAIVKDSFSHNDQAKGDSDIEVEDMDTLYASLPSDAGSEGFYSTDLRYGRGSLQISVGIYKERRVE